MIPHRLDPRRTARLLGVRAYPRTVETAWGLLGFLILLTPTFT